MKQKRVHILTYGCQMNVSDSEKIEAALHSVGYLATPSIKDADMVILNTCSVRAKAEDRIYNVLLTMKGELKSNPRLLIGVGGCVAQQEGERLLKKVPHLSFVFGTHNLHLLPQLVREAEAGRRISETSFMDDDSRLDLFPDQRGGGVTSFVTIMQGCDNFCSYCIVPFVRGREVSRRSGDILDEIHRLVDAGTREITLLGQNVNSYGVKERGKTDFPSLLRQVAAIPALERLRFMTSHPKDMSISLIEAVCDLGKICSHIHLPIQSGSDRVLKMMNRGYSRKEYLQKIELLRQTRPDMLFTSDLIVGFPGETEEDFSETLSLMEEVNFSDSYSFIYSPRPETVAAALPDETTKKEKMERLDRLLLLQRKQTADLHRRLVGSTQRVLVEGGGKRDGQVFGRTSGNRVVNFPGSPAMIGSLRDVSIVKDFQNSLLGEAVQGEDNVS